jgi:lipopolysaccharide transport system ATP-binding protein
MTNAVEVSHLSKNYPLSGSQTARLRRLFASKSSLDDGLWALRDVSFSVKRGEGFAIIGSNGSGKSTLLQMIAGILRPTSGTVTVNGRLSALLELGSGFSPEFSGRDNVYLNGSILGFSREEIDQRFETIERFAQIGDFIDQPVKTYSTGMVLRLAFAVVAHVDPEILIVDEALAVGDIAFRQRCMRRIHDLRAKGTTILFVSHETSDVKALCDRCLWLQNGVVQQIGESDDVVAQYLTASLKREIAHKREEPALEWPASLPDVPQDVVTGLENRHRFGDRRARITGAELLSDAGTQSTELIAQQRVRLRISFRVQSQIDSPVVGFLVRNARGETLFGTNTARENYPVPVLHAGETHTVDFHWEPPFLAAGDYTISLGVSEGNLEEFTVCDYVEDALRATASKGAIQNSRGYFHVPAAGVVIHRH